MVHGQCLVETGVMYQGAVVEDISAYNRTHEMMSILTSKANRDNNDVSGFGRRWDNDYYYPPQEGSLFRGGSSTQVASDESKAEQYFGGIAPGESNSVSFKPLCGILSQSK